MKNWLVLWKTWQEGEITAPWPFVIYEHTNDYKSRTDPTKRISPELVNTIYQSFNSEKVQNFEDNHIDALVIAGVMSDIDEASAVSGVKSIFVDAEIQTCKEISDNDAANLIEVFSKE